MINLDEPRAYQIEAEGKQSIIYSWFRSNKSIQDSVNRLREQSRKSSVGSRVAAASKHYERKPQLKTKENPFTKDVADIGSMNEALKSNIMRKTGRCNCLFSQSLIGL